MAKLDELKQIARAYCKKMGYTYILQMIISLVLKIRMVSYGL